MYVCRWALHGNNDGSVQLQLQVIPLPATTVVAKPLHAADDAFVHIVQGWPVVMDYFDDRNSISGPVPSLFTEQPEELRSYIKDHPDDFHKQLNRFSSR